MNNDSTKSKAVGIFRCYLLVVCYVLMTVVTTNLFMAKWGLRGEAGGKSYQALVSYQGDRPYVYRMLVPALTGAADILMPVLPDNVKRVFRENPPLKRYIRVSDEQVGSADKCLLPYYVCFNACLFVSYLAENPGVPMEDHLMLNIKFWLDYKTYFLLNDAYAPFPLLPKPQHILIFPIILFFLFYNRKEKPTILKFLAGPMFCVLTVLFFSKGFKDEIRVYSLMFPLFYLLSFDTFCRLNSIALENRDL